MFFSVSKNVAVSKQSELHDDDNAAVSRLQLQDLPCEILMCILEFLAYPEALALKLVHPRLKAIVEPTLNVGRRVEWLIERADLGLPVPRWKQLNLRNDIGFTSSPEVRAMLRGRRHHQDCHLLATHTLRHHYHENLQTSSPVEVSRALHIKCVLDPNVLDCGGITQAHHQTLGMDMYDEMPHYTYLDVQQGSIVEHHMPHPPWLSRFSRRRMWKKLHIFSVRFVPAVIGGILHLNRLRLNLMLRVWMLLEFLVLGALIAHVFFGIEYQDMVDYVGALVQYSDRITGLTTITVLKGWTFSVIGRHLPHV